MIHPTSNIHPDAKLGDNVEIGAFCSVGKSVTLGDGVKLEHHIELDGDLSIGKNTHIYSFAKIGNGPISIDIGKDCHIREFATVGINSADNSISIADRCYIMGYADIRSGVTIEQECIITNNVLLDEGSKCETKVIMGAKATLAKKCTIGTGSMIGGASAVQHSIPPFCLVEGYPKAKLRGLNLIGMRRGFDDKESISHVKRAFMTLRKVNFSQKVASDLLLQTKDAKAFQFIEFVSVHSIGE